MTAVHQLQEEADLHVSPLPSVPLMVSEEIPTGFVQLVLLGVDIGEMRFIGPQLEGEAEGISFADLEGKLKQANWVPSGLMQILAWLALGAPGTDEEDWERKPKDIFKNVIENIDREYQWEQPRVNYDPMGIEIQIKKRIIEKKIKYPKIKNPVIKNFIVWDIGRPDGLFTVNGHKGWDILYKVIQKPEKMEKAEIIIGSTDSNPSRTVIDALKNARKNFLEKCYSEKSWRNKLKDRLGSEWARANSSESERLKNLLITSAAVMLTLSHMYMKKDDTEMLGIINDVINHRDKISKKLSYYKNKYSIRTLDGNFIKTSPFAKMSSLHPLFLYSPVVLRRLLEETITTGEMIIYTPSGENPILWDL